MSPYPVTRRAGERDLDAIVGLLVRNKRLNEEFDPMLAATDSIAGSPEKNLRIFRTDRPPFQVPLITYIAASAIALAWSAILSR